MPPEWPLVTLHRCGSKAFWLTAHCQRTHGLYTLAAIGNHIRCKSDSARKPIEGLSQRNSRLGQASSKNHVSLSKSVAKIGWSQSQGSEYH